MLEQAFKNIVDVRWNSDRATAAETRRLAAIYTRKRAALKMLLLHQAFSGEL